MGLPVTAVKIDLFYELFGKVWRNNLKNGPDIIRTVTIASKQSSNYVLQYMEIGTCEL